MESNAGASPSAMLIPLSVFDRISFDCDLQGIGTDCRNRVHEIFNMCECTSAAAIPSRIFGSTRKRG